MLQAERDVAFELMTSSLLPFGPDFVGLQWFRLLWTGKFAVPAT